jgi:hypothetical protein
MGEEWNPQSAILALSYQHLSFNFNRVASSLSGLAASRLIIRYHLVFSIHCVSATSLLVVTIPISGYCFLSRHAVLLSFSAYAFNIQVSSCFRSFCSTQSISIVYTALFGLYYQFHPRSSCLNQRRSMTQMCLFCTGIDTRSLDTSPWSTVDTPQISAISCCSRHLHRLFPLYDCYAHLSSLTTPDLLLHSPHHWRLLYVYPAIFPGLADNHSRMDWIRGTCSCPQQRN